MPHRFSVHKNEDEYFARRDAELIRQQREAAENSRIAAERRSHLMKCPSCGYDLITGKWHGVRIEQCTQCHGIWLDADEAHRLLRESNPNALVWVFEGLLRGVSGVRTGMS